MEELINLAILLLTVLFYLYKTLKKNPDEDILPIPGMPDEVRKGSRQKHHSVGLPENELTDLSRENLRSHAKKDKKTDEVAKHSPLKEVLQSMTVRSGSEDFYNINFFEVLEKQHSVEQRMVIYSEIIKRPDF